MGQARDEHTRQNAAHAANHDTDLMKPTFDEGPGFTSDGLIPPALDSFDAGGPTASDRGYVRVTASTLNVRAAPSKGSDIIGKLQRGAMVQQSGPGFVGQDGDWVQINFNAQTGYVHRKYVATAEPAHDPDGLMRPESHDSDGLMNPSFEDKPTAHDPDGLMRPTFDSKPAHDPDGLMAPSFAVGKPPKMDPEVMQMFREVNGDHGRGKPPGMDADMMNDFREVNGDHGRGKPPGMDAEMMQDFREVNGDAAPAAPRKIDPALLADLE
jgi:hypothetical protein